jgi:lysophospholipase L1-like esterase
MRRHLPANNFRARRTARSRSFQTLEPRTLLTGAPVADAAVAEQAFVSAVYHDELGRGVDAAALPVWTQQLTSGVERLTVAADVVYSDEHLNLFIQAAYVKYLGRQSDQADTDFWRAEMRAGLTDEGVEAAMLASHEFYQSAGGNTAGWANAAYQGLFNRPADPGALAAINSQLEAGVGLATIALTLVRSPEHEGDIVQADFQQLIGQPAGTALTDALSSRLIGGSLTDEALTSLILASDGYFESRTGVVPTVVPTPRPDGWWQDDFAQINARAAQGNANILFVGDSITQLWTTSGKAAWNQDFAPVGAMDAGIGGDGTEQVLYRLNHGNLDGIHPQVVVLMIGINDLIAGATASEVSAGVSAVVQTLRDKLPDAKILLLGLLPAFDNASPIRQEAAAVNQALPGLADNQHVYFVDTWPAFINQDGTTRTELFQTGLVHPDAQGYGVLAQVIGAKLQTLS